MTVRLQNVDDSNWRDCADLHLAEEETKFISSNVYALAEWKFETESVFKAIYADNKLVGMLAYYLHDGEYGYFYWLYHLMIQRVYQGNKIGQITVGFVRFTHKFSQLLFCRLLRCYAMKYQSINCMQ